MSQQPTKYPNGFDPGGSGAVEHLRRSLGPAWQRKRTPGAVAVRNGDLFTVFKVEQDLAAVYSLGRTAAGVWQVRGATNAEGLFGLVGAPWDGVSIDPNTRHYGRALMQSLRLVASSTPVISDFNGGQWTQAVFQQARSRRGIDVTPYYEANSITNNILTARGAYVLIQAQSGYRDAGGTPKFYSGACVTQMGAGGNPVMVFLRDDGESGFALGATLGFAGAVAYYGSVTTLAPGVLMKFDRYFRAGAPYSAAAVLVVTKSTDAGATWAAVPTPTLFGAELATINSLPNDSGNPSAIDAFNEAASWVRVVTAPLSRATSVVLAVVPYMDGGTLRARVKMGVVDVATGAITGSTVLLDATTPLLADTYLKDAIAMPAGVLVLTRPTAPDISAIWPQPARVRLTTDGVTLTDVGNLPLAENHTGTVRALSPRRLVVPVYEEGAHRLLQSIDQGASWTRRAVIATDSRPPQPTDQFQNLADFSDVVFARSGDQPINPYPATPWLTDIRIEHA
ncbi:hypothetical protein [Variovorax sp. RCC_210]|uniref:hypothetical protein n=1 Tax=Variovorax sp. RCC_210 TaxID=3239217 RepID=UPI0035254A1D